MIGQAEQAVLNGSHAATCDQCGQPFEPRIKRGANRDRFCTPACKNKWHNARRQINPIETGEAFNLTLTNPNPKLRKLKTGDRFTIEFEVSRDAFEMFVGVKRKGMEIGAECNVMKRGER